MCERQDQVRGRGEEAFKVKEGEKREWGGPVVMKSR